MKLVSGPLSPWPDPVIRTYNTGFEHHQENTCPSHLASPVPPNHVTANLPAGEMQSTANT